METNEKQVGKELTAIQPAMPAVPQEDRLYEPLTIRQKSAAGASAALLFWFLLSCKDIVKAMMINPKDPTILLFLMKQLPMLGLAGMAVIGILALRSRVFAGLGTALGVIVSIGLVGSLIALGREVVEDPYIQQILETSRKTAIVFLVMMLWYAISMLLLLIRRKQDAQETESAKMP